jgi:hypothetical protein
MPPSVVHHAIDVAATPEACWRLFSDLTTWTRWFPMLHAVAGELRAGGRLTLTFAAGPVHLPVEVRIEELRPGEIVRWVGGRLGIQGDHSYSFAVHHPGTTRVTSREAFSGFGARLISGPVLARLDGEVHQSMARFKALVEAATAT